MDRRQVHCSPRDLKTIEGFKRVNEILLCSGALLRQLIRTVDFGRGFETIVQKLKRVAPASLSDCAVISTKQRSQTGIRFGFRGTSRRRYEHQQETDYDEAADAPHGMSFSFNRALRRERPNMRYIRTEIGMRTIKEIVRYMKNSSGEMLYMCPRSGLVSRPR
jgi:hypothetical protein